MQALEQGNFFITVPLKVSIGGAAKSVMVGFYFYRLQGLHPLHRQEESSKGSLYKIPGIKNEKTYCTINLHSRDFLAFKFHGSNPPRTLINLLKMVL